ncbi:hypothetical protein OUZ56_000524 [Daphnia magna]|uniref:Uncharacterized protein n=1 Tax=Daphnia magna TaxID=35525 RepID=A0ABR0A019_9CRUS|nr:hypothetical protein OUZ56_000524 [Daphnia magna]
MAEMYLLGPEGDVLPPDFFRRRFSMIAVKPSIHQLIEFCLNNVHTIGNTTFLSSPILNNCLLLQDTSCVERGTADRQRKPVDDKQLIQFALYHLDPTLQLSCFRLKSTAVKLVYTSSCHPRCLTLGSLFSFALSVHLFAISLMNVV